MTRNLLAIGYLTWDAVERRSDRYGSIRLKKFKSQEILTQEELNKIANECANEYIKQKGLIDFGPSKYNSEKEAHEAFEKYCAKCNEKDSKEQHEIINAVKDQLSSDVLIDLEMSMKFEGLKGKLIAKVVEPVKSPHMGDLHRKLFPTTPELNEEVIFGTGELFFERKGDAPHELAKHENDDKSMMSQLVKEFEKAGVKAVIDPDEDEDEIEPIYDLIGLKPDDGREKDWLDPKAFYRTHLSKVELYFEQE